MDALISDGQASSDGRAHGSGRDAFFDRGFAGGRCGCGDYRNRRRAVGAHELGPDAVPVLRPQIPPHDTALRLGFDADAQFGAGLSVVQPRRELREVDPGDSELLCECGRTSVGQLFGVGLQVHGGMQSAQLRREHTAQLRGMQPAYARCVKNESLRHRNRRAQLAVAIHEAGGPAALAKLVGTPKQHISALTAGARGIGDALAAKIELRLRKFPGWMDRAENPSPEISPAEWATVLDLRDITDPVEREQARVEVATRAERWRHARRLIQHEGVSKPQETAPANTGAAVHPLPPTPVLPALGTPRQNRTDRVRPDPQLQKAPTTPPATKSPTKKKPRRR